MIDSRPQDIGQANHKNPLQCIVFASTWVCTAEYSSKCTRVAGSAPFLHTPAPSLTPSHIIIIPPSHSGSLSYSLSFPLTPYLTFWYLTSNLSQILLPLINHHHHHPTLSLPRESSQSLSPPIHSCCSGLCTTFVPRVR